MEEKIEIRKTLIAIGLSLSINEIGYNKALSLIDDELDRYETLVKNLTIPVVGVTCCDCNKPRYIDKGDVLRCTKCNKASAIV